MSAEKVRSHRLQEQPAEGDRHVIDRELARNKQGQKEISETSSKRAKINPESTPGSGMLPPVDDDDDPNMAPTG